MKQLAGPDGEVRGVRPDCVDLPQYIGGHIAVQCQQRHAPTVWYARMHLVADCRLGPPDVGLVVEDRNSLNTPWVADPLCAGGRAEDMVPSLLAWTRAEGLVARLNDVGIDLLRWSLM